MSDQTKPGEPFNAIQVVMMPRDTNPFGTVLLGYKVTCGYTPMAQITSDFCRSSG